MPREYPPPRRPRGESRQSRVQACAPDGVLALTLRESRHALVVIVKVDGGRDLFALCLRQDLVISTLIIELLFDVGVSEGGRHLLGPMLLKDLVGRRDHKVKALLLEDVN